MGAREDLFEAARGLTRGGVSRFSPAQLIAEARTNGSQYPEGTLRTHIVSLVCADAPTHHGTRYGRFAARRVAASRTYRDNPVLLTKKVLEAAES